MLHRITVMPQNQNIQAEAGSNLLEVLRLKGLAPDAPCGGNGTCGKCKLVVDGKLSLACRTIVNRDMTILLPKSSDYRILTDDTLFQQKFAHGAEGYSLSFDIGTTTVVGNLIDRQSGIPLSCCGITNPQSVFGADVISRLRHAVNGYGAELTRSIRGCLEDLTIKMCQDAGVSSADIRMISMVGNPAMQQFALGIPVDNLAKLPFAPVLNELKYTPGKNILPLWQNADVLIVPDIAAFIGSDTVACLLTAEIDCREETMLMVDVGTNAEMVLGNRDRMVACSAAAGPALEGAGIRFGMGAQSGAIDHVRYENGSLQCTVIGDGTALGICGSGLVDAVAAALDAGWLNTRGKILTQDGCIHLTENIFLDQEDIRKVQLAKGAIGAGIQLMANHIGISLSDISAVYLAGAFGCYMDPHSACRIGMLPEELEDRIIPIGNAAHHGANILAFSQAARDLVTQILTQTEPLELSSLKSFPRSFAKNMRFSDGKMD